MSTQRRTRPRRKARRRTGAGPGAGARTARGAAARPGAGAAGKALRARDLMTRDPVTVREDLSIGALCDLLQERNINGAPVVDGRGNLVGVVTQEDIIYGAMGQPDTHAVRPGREGTPLPSGETGRGRRGRQVVAMLRERRLREVPQPAPAPGEKRFWSETARSPDAMILPVRTIMTSPAISAEEDTPVRDLCRVMWSLKIHRVPIVRGGKVTGLVSSMDLCRAIIENKIRLA